MVVIQQVLFEVTADYLGHPYFVSGNALFNAIAPRVNDRVRASLEVSNGVFLPGEYGEYPVAHSQSGYAGKLGTSLPGVERYEDLFVFRDAAQRWLLDSRPRDAHNALDLQEYGGRMAFGAKCLFGRPPEVRNSKRTVQWFVHCYLHGRDRDGNVVPVAEEALDCIQVGGARNYGFGELRVADSQLVDLDALDYSRLKEASGGFVLELVSPHVVASEYPGADDQSVPWWWEPGVGGGIPGSEAGARGDGLRRRETRLVDGESVYAVSTVDHGQVVGYAGDDPVATARNGVLRVGTHSRYGFGELRVRPRWEDRVPERVVDEPSGEQKETGGEGGRESGGV